MRQPYETHAPPVGRLCDAARAPADLILEPKTAPLPERGEPTGSGALALRLLSDRRGKTIRVGERPMTIGSEPNADLRIFDRTVSRQHARVHASAGSLELVDLSSRNGVFIDGIRVQRASLRAGARIRIGRTTLVVVSERSGSGGDDAGRYVAEGPKMRALLSDVGRLSQSNDSVLIQGESGVGKDGLARMIHESSGRQGRYVAINAGALGRSELRSELFGHVRGAFTGAEREREGAFVRAAGGTLFLDEIGELGPSAQAAILRAIETRVIRPLGSDTERPVDVRLICATHRDLLARAAEGEFRADLYYRLACLRIEVPPLRDRRAEIPALARELLRRQGTGRTERRFSEAALARLRQHHWPGNIRELSNIVARARLRAAGEVITDADIRASFDPGAIVAQVPGDNPYDDAVAIVDAHGGNISAAARSLGIPRSTLRHRLQRGDLARG